MAADHPVLRCADVQRVAYRDADRELFDRLLRDFVPPDAFDAHAEADARRWRRRCWRLRRVLRGCPANRPGR